MQSQSIRIESAGTVKSKFRQSPFLQRVLSAVILFPITVVVLWLGFPYSEALIALIAAVLVGEWIHLCWCAQMSMRRKGVWLAVGTYYLLAGCVCFWLIGSKYGWSKQAYLLILASVNDISAYVVGSWLKGPKLAPEITPNKTWSGSAAGVLGVLLLGGIASVLGYPFIEGIQGFPLLMVSYFVISLTAQLGDLLESWAKRRFGVKDSSNLIPGHGGFLDRLDSLLAASVIGWGLLTITSL